MCHSKPPLCYTNPVAAALPALGTEPADNPAPNTSKTSTTFSLNKQGNQMGQKEKAPHCLDSTSRLNPMLLADLHAQGAPRTNSAHTYIHTALLRITSVFLQRICSCFHKNRRWNNSYALSFPPAFKVWKTCCLCCNHTQLQDM